MKLRCDICSIEIDGENGIEIWMFVYANDPDKVRKFRCRRHLAER